MFFTFFYAGLFVVLLLSTLILFIQAKKTDEVLISLLAIVACVIVTYKLMDVGMVDVVERRLPLIVPFTYLFAGFVVFSLLALSLLIISYMKAGTLRVSKNNTMYATVYWSLGYGMLVAAHLYGLGEVTLQLTRFTQYTFKFGEVYHVIGLIVAATSFLMGRQVVPQGHEGYLYIFGEHRATLPAGVCYIPQLIPWLVLIFDKGRQMPPGVALVVEKV